MLEVSYDKIVPFPFEVVLSQYFDYEHIAHVHPTTLGEYRLVEREGDRIVYDQIWPPGWFGRRRVSRVVQRFFPPNRTTFEFVSGLHRGIVVDATLLEHPEGTLVRETYRLGLPNWKWLRPLLLPLMMRTIDRVWEEDLRVEVCYGGLPGIPDRTAAPPAAMGRRIRTTPPPTRHDLGSVEDFPPDGARCATVGGAEVAVISRAGARNGAQAGATRCAVSNRCPHTGGPLSLGRIEGEAVVCPWHGAAFDLGTGRALRGPTTESILVYVIREEAGRLVLEGRTDAG